MLKKNIYIQSLCVRTSLAGQLFFYQVKRCLINGQTQDKRGEKMKQIRWIQYVQYVRIMNIYDGPVIVLS